MEQLTVGGISANENIVFGAASSVFRLGFLVDAGHDQHLVLFLELPVLLHHLLELHVRHQIPRDQDKIRADQGLGVNVPESVTHGGAGLGFDDPELDLGGGLHPAGGLQVSSDGLCVRAAVHENLLDPGNCQELDRVVDERAVHQREEGSRLLDSDRQEAVVEAVGDHHCLNGVIGFDPVTHGCFPAPLGCFPRSPGARRRTVCSGGWLASLYVAIGEYR